MRRRDCVLALGAAAAAGCSRTPGSALQRGVRFLWNEQAADGGWHSRKYGLLRSGQSLTPFVLDALLQVPGEVYSAPADQIQRAFAFLKRNTDSEGALGRMDPAIPDYPNYATALGVLAFSRARRPDDRDAIARMTAYLRGRQFTEQNGWHRDHPVYGGWGMGGDRRTPPDTGHVDLSMTRHVLQALAAGGAPANDAAFTKARTYLERCQNPDGGFIFSTFEPDTNKAGEDGGHWRSYGTTTADGVLSLLATGASLGDDRVRRAREWLTTRHRTSGAPGFLCEAYRKWTEGLRFYYAGASGEAFRRLRQPAIYDMEKLQRPDGSWANSANLVKEDDPLIATGFAIRALL